MSGKLVSDTIHAEDFWHKFLRLYTFNFNDQFLKCGLLEIKTFRLVRSVFGTLIFASFVREPGKKTTL